MAIVRRKLADVNGVFAQEIPASLLPLNARMSISPFSDAPVLARWLEAEYLDAILGRYARNWPQADLRAVASQWHQECIALILPPLLLARLLCGNSVSFDPETLRMVVDEQGAPIELHLPEVGHRLDFSADGAKQLEELFEHLLQPFVLFFAARTGLAPRLLWGNVALCVNWVLDVAMACQPTRLLREARAHFTNPLSSSQCRSLCNALQRDAMGLKRRVCCLRERLPLPRCTVCPLAPTQDQFNQPTQP